MFRSRGTKSLSGNFFTLFRIADQPLYLKRMKFHLDTQELQAVGLVWNHVLVSFCLRSVSFACVFRHLSEWSVDLLMYFPLFFLVPGYISLPKFYNYFLELERFFSIKKKNWIKQGKQFRKNYEQKKKLVNQKTIELTKSGADSLKSKTYNPLDSLILER